MKKQIIKISIFQTCKVTTVLYMLFGFIYSVIGIFILLFGSQNLRAMAFIYLLMPLIMAVFGFIGITLFAWVYNCITKFVGGIEFEVKDIE